jgi:hypothetical protein
MLFGGVDKAKYSGSLTRIPFKTVQAGSGSNSYQHARFVFRVPSNYTSLPIINLPTLWGYLVTICKLNQ